MTEIIAIIMVIMYMYTARGVQLWVTCPTKSPLSPMLTPLISTR